MPDNKAKRGGMDAKRISTKEDYEVAYWCDKFCVNKAQLLAAVDQVGDLAADVEKFFAER